MAIRNKCYNTCFYLHDRFSIRQLFIIKKLYPLINDQYTVRPDETFRFVVGSFIENVWFVLVYRQRYEISVTIPVSTFTIDLVFENCFLSAMAPYVYSRDGRSLSIYGSECQIWKTWVTLSYLHTLVPVPSQDLDFQPHILLSFLCSMIWGERWLPHFCACAKPGSGFQKPYVQVYLNWILNFIRICIILNDEHRVLTSEEKYK
jgi:hypothetical protein